MSAMLRPKFSNNPIELVVGYSLHAHGGLLWQPLRSTDACTPFHMTSSRLTQTLPCEHVGEMRSADTMDETMCRNVGLVDGSKKVVVLHSLRRYRCTGSCQVWRPLILWFGGMTGSRHWVGCIANVFGATNCIIHKNSGHVSNGRKIRVTLTVTYLAQPRLENLHC